MLADEDVSERVARILVEALNVDEDQIKPQATLQGDLGAESIDFLDIVFRLEREFGILMPTSPSRRNTMSTKSIDSAPSSPCTVACGFIWSSAPVSASPPRGGT